MTLEILKFKCPYCRHVLGEEEAKRAELNKQKEIDEKVQEKLQQEIELVVERIRMDMEKEEKKRTERLLAEQKLQMESKHRQEIAEKNQQIEASKLDLCETIEEKIRQGIIEKQDDFNQRTKEYQTQIKRLAANNEDLSAECDKQKRILESIPPELKGTSGEFILIDELREEFRTDDIIGKKVGVQMADVIQNIVTEKGERVLVPIVFDKKMGKVLTKTDIEKAKNYKTIHNTDYCIIVTEDIKRRDMKHSGSKFTEEREGVLLVHPWAVVDIAKQIRNFLIEESKQRKNNTGRELKQSKLYDYLTSPEYSRNIKTRLDMKLKLDELQRKEEDYHRSTWSKRDQFIKKWFEVDRNNDRNITDITQEDDSINSYETTPDEEDEDDPSS